MAGERAPVRPARVLTLVVPLVVTLGLACGARGARSSLRPARTVSVPHRSVRVILGAERGTMNLTTDAVWHLTDSDHRTFLRPSSPGGWGIERRGARVRAVHSDGYSSPWVESTIVLVLDDSSRRVRYGGREYRGDLAFTATDSATLVVNVLDVEAYLRGVVPLEMGARPESDRAAVEAQAVVARSFTVERMNDSNARSYDLTASELDQVYGGASAETAQGNAAVAATSGIVLSYQGRAIGAPYHAVCGGTTAAAHDVWKTAGVPYLQSVSDRVPGTDRSYCDLSPRFHWERSFSALALRDLADRYLRQYAVTAQGSLGAVRNVQVTANAPSGRVAALRVETEAGTYAVTGNDIRFVLRGASGDLLPSTYFSLEPVVGRDGRLMQLIVRGRGNGHGVGMCQWGAIGRARAGQDAPTILRAYFPAAELARGT